MTSDYRNWINDFDPGFRNLPALVENELKHFLYLWSMFEAWCFECDLRQTEVASRALNWVEAGVNADGALDEQTDYFRARYGRDERAADHLDALLGRRRLNAQNEALLRRFVAEETEAPNDVLHGLICIIYRLRNNLFHGEKLSAGLAGQQLNFYHANQVLMHIMDASPRYSSD